MKTFYNLSLWLTVATIFHISCIVPATAQGPGVWFDTAPYVYATPDSGTYTRTRKMQGSLIYSETWSPLKPKKAAVKIATVVSGLGEMSIDFSSSLGDAAYAGISIGSATTQIGRPVYTALKKAPLVYEASGDFPSLEPGTTSPWNGSGSVTLVALVWRESGSGGLPAVVGWGGSWSNGTSVTKKASNDGEWTIAAETKVQCSSPYTCNKGGWVDTANEHQVSCTACSKTYYNCYAANVTLHTTTTTCEGCSETIRSCMAGPNGASPHGWQICMDCVYNDNPGGVSNKCEGPHVCAGDTTRPTVSSNNGGTTSSSGGNSGDSGSSVACARGSSCSLGGRVSSANAHRRTCLGGHTYWICHSSRLGYGNEYHRTRTCQRTGCGVSSSRCLNGSSRSPCTGTGRNYRYHKF